MQTSVFNPLDMKRTTYDPTIAMTYPVAQEHEINDDGTLSVLHRFVYNTAYQPSGFLMSTVLDLANFAIMHMNSGRFHDKQILSPASITAMHTPQIYFHTIRNEGYGLTLRMDTYKGKRVIVHNGIFRATTSMFSMSPSEKVAVIMLFNGFYAGSAADSIVNTIYDQLLGLPKQHPQPQPVEPDKSQWLQYVGTYLGLLSGGLVTIFVQDDQLTITNNGKTLPLQAFKKDLYFWQDPSSNAALSVGFLPEKTGPTQYITVNGAPRHRIQLDSSFIPDPSSWQAYAGTYTGSTGTIIIHLENDQLWLQDKEDKMDVPCTPLDNARFASALGLIEFIPNDNGTISTLKRGKMFTHTRTK